MIVKSKLLSVENAALSIQSPQSRQDCPLSKSTKTNDDDYKNRDVPDYSASLYASHSVNSFKENCRLDTQIGLTQGDCLFSKLINIPNKEISQKSDDKKCKGYNCFENPSAHFPISLNE